LSTKIVIKDAADPVEIDGIDTVEFDNVSFGYFEGSDPVIKNITFKIKKGEKIGIIGGTGSGKSTLINLIPRFYDATEGTVKINGIDLRQVKQNSLRKKIGYVPQESFVLSGTAEDNIRFGKENVNTNQLKEIIGKVQLSDFISKLPDGLKVVFIKVVKFIGRQNKI
jgi:ABC-type multidrug transport system fused ATPase/permease subunit